MNKREGNSSKPERVDTVEETKIIKAEMNFVLRKNFFTMKKRVLLFYVKFLVNNQFAHAEISVE